MAQAQKEVDSTVIAARKQIYENPDKAIQLAQTIYDYPNVSVNNKINSLLIISTAYSSKRDYKKSSEYVERIKELFPEIENNKIRMNILNRIGGHYQELQIYDKAIEYLDEALILIEDYPDQDSIQSFLGYNATLRGFIYREQMNCDIAIKFFNKAIEAYESIDEDHVKKANLSICLYNKGNCLLSLGKIEEAKTSFLTAIAYGKDVDALSLIAFGKKGLAEAKTLEGNYNEAITLLKKANTISENVGDLILNKVIYEALANNYLALNDWENYNYYHNKYISLQKETKNAERKSVNQSIIILTETKAMEIDQLKNKYKPIQIGLLIFIAIALFVLIRLIFSGEKRLKKLQKKLKT